MKRKRVLSRLVCIAVLLSIFILTVCADIGPKPSTDITIHEGSGKTVIVTLLAEQENYGPNSTVKKDADPASWWDDLTPEEEAAWLAFRDYEDPDGYHFWGNVSQNEIHWGYYPPERFKIAVYYPQEEILLVSSEIYERYAFESGYTLYLRDIDYSTSAAVSMDLRKSFDRAEEAAALIFRIAATLFIELLLALFWGYRSGSRIRLILMMNLVTQLGLNVLLWFWYTCDGPMTAMFRLVLGEVIVLLAEAIVYARKLPEGKGRRKAVLYAIAANLTSVIVGWLLLD